jgi:hypothetical protein
LSFLGYSKRDHIQSRLTFKEKLRNDNARIVCPAYIGRHPRCAMDRNALAARILKIDGFLLLIVAAIHFIATPFALRFVASQSTPEAWVQIGPPFLLSFTLVGVLLLPLGLSTIYCAGSVKRGERWARTICIFNAGGVLLLPLALVLIMPTRYFRAMLFVVAATLVWIVAISMAVPLVLGRADPSLPTSQE